MKYQKVLIDLSGTIHIDDQPVPAAIEALQKFVFKHLIKFFFCILKVIFLDSEMQD